jgi:hypothetical protein
VGIPPRRDAHEQARVQVRQSVNSAMMASYWEIGRLVVEREQQGQARAAYGKRQMDELSLRLTAQFGKGFDASNLRNISDRRRVSAISPCTPTALPCMQGLLRKTLHRP